jgi:hypothetical protein
MGRKKRQNEKTRSRIPRSKRGGGGGGGEVDVQNRERTRRGERSWML